MQDSRQLSILHQVRNSATEALTAAMSNSTNLTSALKADVAHEVSSLWISPANLASRPSSNLESEPTETGSPQAACADLLTAVGHDHNGRSGRSSFQFGCSPGAKLTPLPPLPNMQGPPEDNSGQGDNELEHGKAGTSEASMARSQDRTLDNSQTADRRSSAAWVLPVMAALADDKAGRGRLGRALVGQCLHGFLAAVQAMPAGGSKVRL